MKKFEDIDCIEISDIFVASCLLSLDFPMRKAVKKGQYYHYFFDNRPEVKEVIKKYYSNNLQVPAKRLAQEYKSLKQMRFNM